MAPGFMVWGTLNVLANDPFVLSHLGGRPLYGLHLHVGRRVFGCLRLIV